MPMPWWYDLKPEHETRDGQRINRVYSRRVPNERGKNVMEYVHVTLTGDGCPLSSTVFQDGKVIKEEIY
jgi:hypothetical protein